MERPSNLGWGAVSGPGQWSLDCSLGKYFSVAETVTLQLCTDMFNAPKGSVNPPKCCVSGRPAPQYVQYNL